MALNFNELRDLLLALNQTDIAELTLKSEEFELTVRRGTTAEAIPVARVEVPVLQQPVIAETAAIPVAAPPTAPAAPPHTADQRWVEIKSPMVGTFYRAPGPDEHPFVEVGDRVRSGQTVCIIEAMKLMNEIEAEISGEVVEILVQNAQPVEFGQVLMRVNPA
ncbi:acetyl-CoA carboxylase biotin carboxyl carrier protein [Alkalinema sp. FACHB-956]|uniref:acetyl-CoA carboxylase biotin carboxyl carrier protein n=1 Tax=Alkalinema sp. FACHB-956 TaxID=2692768 RepID=UPI001688801A|nr:acetyl-CoA carboxylase biotin carboxyl carrier protein [Alkalinema sp. FACHB-956]